VTTSVGPMKPLEELAAETAIKWHSRHSILHSDLSLRLLILSALTTATKELREDIERLEQRVGDFQIASLIDVGGGPCNVEPHHVESHVTELREENERLRKEIEDQTRRAEEAAA
jgi:hypothetical protein